MIDLTDPVGDWALLPYEEPELANAPDVVDAISESICGEDEPEDNCEVKQEIKESSAREVPAESSASSDSRTVY